MGPIAPIAMPAMPAITDFAGPGVANTQGVSDNDNAKSFMNTLEDAFDNLNELQLRSSDMTTAYANHQTSDLQSVMVASEQASISMQMATQVRNKVVEAYQNIMQMQI